MLTMSSLALSDAILALACLFAVFMMAQQKAFADLHKGSATAALIGFILMGLASIVGSLRYGFSNIWASPHEMLSNAAMYMAPPLIGIATILGVSTKAWNKPIWGKLIIGICLMYEVSRWYGMDIIYRDLQNTVLLLIIVYSVFRNAIDNNARWLVLTGVSSYFIGALIIGTEGTLAGYLRLDLFRYLIGLGNLLMGTGLYFVFKDRTKQTL
ncbi:hypothetical protein [uncultured Endozoicomonas sp.]|uniref:hypothetical protein n=1 Tax=uncultured Endozoicomonas sp. TaxID=432652 RepID=UPI00262AEDFB|nr:hypothetical protein [uncultured Endozoicomonas sp.]